MRKVQVRVPGSKSHTHRALICAALAEGESLIESPLLCQDTLYTLRALRALGVRIGPSKRGIVVEGVGGRLKAPTDPIHLGNSGTSLRFLTAVCALVSGETILTGSPRLLERPIGPLVDALGFWGVEVEDQGGYPPVVVRGGRVLGGRTKVDCSISSQFLSGLLLLGPYAESEAEIEAMGQGVSGPYVDVTCEVMKAFGMEVERRGCVLRVPKGVYRGSVFEVEPDPSSATYPFLAGAITSKEVKVLGLRLRGKHPDLEFLSVLEQMGCRVRVEEDGVSLRGGELKGVEVDMSSMPDSVPSLAVAAAFARGETVIKGVGHLRFKESDRIEVISRSLEAMGIEVEVLPDGLRIYGGRPRACLIDPQGDHRIAMAFAIASLRVPGIVIKGPECVRKSFPGFWKVLRAIKDDG